MQFRSRDYHFSLIASNANPIGEQLELGDRVERTILELEFSHRVKRTFFKVEVDGDLSNDPCFCYIVNTIISVAILCSCVWM